MLTIQNGQCGLCKHFGEVHAKDAKLAQLRKSHQAPENLVDECDHPRLVPLHLMVAPNSRCDGYEAATAQG